VPLRAAVTQPPATIICALRTRSPIGPIPQPTHFQDPVDRRPQLARDEREALRLSGEPIGVRVRPHARRLRDALARHDDRARERFVAGLLVDGVRFARQHRLVDLQCARIDDARVGGNLIARAQDEDVVLDDVARRDLDLDAVAPQARRRGIEQRELVESRLRTELLPASDDRVGEGRESEDRILPAAEHEQHEEAREHDPVEQREDVRADDRPCAAARIRRIRVRASGGDALGHLRGGESGRGVDLEAILLGGRHRTRGGIHDHTLVRTRRRGARPPERASRPSLC
jgi:hypothetical protein